MQVYHQEGTTLGTDASSLKQALMSKNKQIFLSKWGPSLQGILPPPITTGAVRK